MRLTSNAGRLLLAVYSCSPQGQNLRHPLSTSASRLRKVVLPLSASDVTNGKVVRSMSTSAIRHEKVVHPFSTSAIRLGKVMHPVSTSAIRCRTNMHPLSTSAIRGGKVVAYKSDNNLEQKVTQASDEIAEKRKAVKEKLKFAVDAYVYKNDIHRRGHVEFIYSSLNQMKELKALDDLDVYKKLLEVFPQEKMVAQSMWQVEFMHFPRQQQCAIDIMDEMEYNGVIPDQEFGNSLNKIFGTKAHAFRKYQRMMYWMPKFKNANPYPVAKQLPDDASFLAVLALRRMAVDHQNFIDVWKTSHVETDPLEDTFVASAQSPEQRELIEHHPVKTPIFVEGGYTTWLRDQSLTYFVLRANPSAQRMGTDKKTEEKDLCDWRVYDEEEAADILPTWGMHEQKDGTILGMCITGTNSKDSLVTWIRYLQRTNPQLEHIPVVFSLRTVEGKLQVAEADNKHVINT